MVESREQLRERRGQVSYDAGLEMARTVHQSSRLDITTGDCNGDLVRVEKGSQQERYLQQHRATDDTWRNNPLSPNERVYQADKATIDGLIQADKSQ